MSRYHIRQSDVKPYSPANHTGTRNFRMIGPEIVGSTQVEMLIGELEGGKGAVSHAHPGIEQVCYLLEGEAHVEVDGDAFDMKVGEACFFPADTKHLFVAMTPKVRVMVIYSPPYGEDPTKVIR